MISTATLKRHKLDAESLKPLFNQKALQTAKGKKDEKGVGKLVDLIRERIRDGRDRSLKDYRVWAAVDLGFDAPFHATTPTLIRHILDTCSSAQQTYDAVKSWGLCEGDLFCKSGQKDPQGKDILELNAPVFFNVFVPVVRAYLTVRLGKLFNDRNLTPLFKYEPQKNTSENRIRCEIVTDIVQAISSAFGYSATLRQTIFQALLYSVCIMFPVEPWYVEKQEDDNGKDFTVKEGIRYTTPHITRMFWDLQHPLSSFNSDSGGSFAGYWSTLRWGEIDRNEQYWNKDAISYGTDWTSKEAPYHNYFTQAYPCTLTFPTVTSTSKETDRENIANTYTSADYDKGIFVTHLFMKLKPKDWGMGDYKHPVWFRFIVASDDTVIYAEPFPYCPVVYTGYDADNNRGKNASLALEILPWQDHLGNVLTQILLTIKRNLANIIFYDTQQVDPEVLNRLERRSQWQYQQMNFVGFDSFKNLVAQKDNRQAIHEVKFAFADTAQMTAAIGTIISILERLLVISPQEIGSSATHQQSKAEVVIINSNTTNRVTYTGSFVDDACDAWKVQLYDGARAFMDDEVVAQVSTDILELEKHLKELGFTSVTKTATGKKLIVKGKKSGLNVEGFASTREGPERGNDREAAAAMYQAIQSLNQNPGVAGVADPTSILELLEQAAKMAGADKDFKIRVNRDALLSQQLLQATEQIKGEVMKIVEEQVAKPAAEAVNEQEQKLGEQQKAMDALTGIVDQLQEIVMAAQQAPPLPPPEPLIQALPPPAPIATEPVIIPGAPAGVAEALPLV